jgi:Phosphotransferase enzyme family
MLEGLQPSTLTARLEHFARDLASMHAATIGKQDRLAGLRLPLGLQDDPPYTALPSGARADCNSAVEVLGNMELELTSEFLHDVQLVMAAMENPGPFLAMVHADFHPDNVVWDGERLRLIDFAHAGYRHALLDAAYPRMLFPTGPRPARIPSPVLARIESAYQASFSQAHPGAPDDGFFKEALVQACVFWSLRTLIVQREWGSHVTLNRRKAASLRAASRACTEYGVFPEIARIADLAALAYGGSIVTPEQDVPLWPAYQ